VARPVVVVHGGAGNPPPERIGDGAEHHAALRAAVEAAIEALPGGAPAAARAAVELLEDHPLFNAGRGSVLTSAGGVEMDASVMDGRTGSAGAVAAVTTVRYPVALAQAVADHAGHMLLVGEGADRFAAEQGLERRDPSWFVTRSGGAAGGPGTVGAVVLDGEGGLAAATSTGGRRGQLPGRVGDSAVIGAGTWADATRAVSMTGDGEAIMRRLSAHAIAHSAAPLGRACDDAIAALEPAEAGLIALDADGAIAMPFNTRVMHRGWWTGASAGVETRVNRDPRE
jgi:beta-aspartyl-peptidase (threonine type)